MGKTSRPWTPKDLSETAELAANLKNVRYDSATKKWSSTNASDTDETRAAKEIAGWIAIKLTPDVMTRAGSAEATKAILGKLDSLVDAYMTFVYVMKTRDQTLKTQYFSSQFQFEQWEQILVDIAVAIDSIWKKGAMCAFDKDSNEEKNLIKANERSMQFSAVSEHAKSLLVVIKDLIERLTAFDKTNFASLITVPLWENALFRKPSHEKLIETINEKMGNPDRKASDAAGAAFKEVWDAVNDLMPTETAERLRSNALVMPDDVQECIRPNWKNICSNSKLKKGIYDVLIDDVKAFLQAAKEEKQLHTNRARDLEQTVVSEKGAKIGLQPGHADNKFIDCCFHKSVITTLEYTISEVNGVLGELVDCSKLFHVHIYLDEAHALFYRDHGFQPILFEANGEKKSHMARADAIHELQVQAKYSEHQTERFRKMQEWNKRAMEFDSEDAEGNHEIVDEGVKTLYDDGEDNWTKMKEVRVVVTPIELQGFTATELDRVFEKLSFSEDMKRNILKDCVFSSMPKMRKFYDTDETKAKKSKAGRVDEETKAKKRFDAEVAKYNSGEYGAIIDISVAGNVPNHATFMEFCKHNIPPGSAIISCSEEDFKRNCELYIIIGFPKDRYDYEEHGTEWTGQVRYSKLVLEWVDSAKSYVMVKREEDDADETEKKGNRPGRSALNENEDAMLRIINSHKQDQKNNPRLSRVWYGGDKMFPNCIDYHLKVYKDWLDNRKIQEAVNADAMLDGDTGNPGTPDIAPDAIAKTRKTKKRKAEGDVVVFAKATPKAQDDEKQETTEAMEVTAMEVTEATQVSEATHSENADPGDSLCSESDEGEVYSPKKRKTQEPTEEESRKIARTE